MNIIAALSGATRGWIAILRGQPGWREHFSLTRQGLVTAIVVYFLFAFIAILVGTIGFGGVSVPGLLVGLMVFALYLWALVIGIYGVRIVTQQSAPVVDMLVPGVHAMTAYLVIGTILSTFGPPMITLALAMAAWLLYRLGRVVGEWSVVAAAAFAAFTTLLLVAMPFTLYMLTSPDLPTP
jgi:hypothetical protein